MVGSKAVPKVASLVMMMAVGLVRMMAVQMVALRVMRTAVE